MSYQAWSVVFGEQPSASKWNILGTNDASFNDGTGIADDAIIARHIADNVVDMYYHTSFSGCRLTKSASQSIATDTITPATFDTEDFDTDGYHSTASNTSRITVPKAGVYLFKATISWASNATGIRFAWLGKNGNNTTNRWGQLSQQAVNGDAHHAVLVTLLSLSANDYVELIAYQTSGGNLNMLGENVQPGFSEFSCIRIGSL